MHLDPGRKGWAGFALFTCRPSRIKNKKEMKRKKIIFKEETPAFRVETPRFREEKPVVSVLQFILYVTGVVVALLGIAMILLMLTSCSIIDEDTSNCPEEAKPGSAIAFMVGDSTASAQTVPGSTRTAQGTLTLDGAGINEESLKGNGFGVFACHTGTRPYVSSAVTANYMWNQPVTYDARYELWDYSPVVYWPQPVDDVRPYVSFFAYAPYSTADGTTDNASKTIVAFSGAGDSGDPWLIYQLGGTGLPVDGGSGWQESQTDLLYDFRKDCQQGEIPERIAFDFKHALACAGDTITVTCNEALQTKMMAAYDADPVTLTLDSVVFDYSLLRKGRLRLNSAESPNWQAVASEDPMVHRSLSFRPDRVIATATSASVCELADFVATGQGIFYIPLEESGNPQSVDITVGYSTSQGNSGKLMTTISLPDITGAGTARNLNVVLSEVVDVPKSVSLSFAETEVTSDLLVASAYGYSNRYSQTATVSNPLYAGEAVTYEIVGSTKATIDSQTGEVSMLEPTTGTPVTVKATLPATTEHLEATATYELTINPVTFTYDFTGGAQVFTVPVSGVYQLRAWGAESADDGPGDYAALSVKLAAGLQLSLYVGGTEGYNSGHTHVADSSATLLLRASKGGADNNFGNLGYLGTDGYTGYVTGSYSAVGGQRSGNGQVQVTIQHVR